MKDKEQTTKALQILMDNAETDFEKHRIEILIQDLQAGEPKVEVIDESHQRFADVIYKKSKSGHFDGSSGIHRAVWSYVNGEIPQGYEIHHKDDDKANNSIGNLQLVTKSEHLKIHYPQKHKAKQKEFICKKCGEKFIAISNGRNFYCPECRHPTKICLECGKQFKPAVGNKATFCSLSCALKHRHKDHREKKNCPVCGKEFEVRKSHINVYCSPECRKIAVLERQEKNYTRICPVCGKSFQSEKKAAKYCSKDCSAARRKIEREQKICQNCGKLFTPRTDTAKFCSTACARASHKYSQSTEPSICQWCGKEYYPLYKNSKSKFCSIACRSNFEYHQNKNGTLQKCLACGKEFLAHKGQKVCSHRCATKWRDMNREPISRLKTCPICGKTFDYGKHKEKIYCSKSCAIKGMWAKRQAK